MNIRRGLLRLWVIFAVVCAVFSFCIFFHDTREAFEKANTIETLSLPNGNTIQGIPTNLSTEEVRKKLVKAGIAPDDKFDLEAALAKAPRAPSPWPKVLEMLFFAFGIPLLILALGRSLLWAIAGFRK